MKKIIKSAKERGTDMGKKFAALGKSDDPVPVCIEQLKRILFFNPNNRKFVITNFSDDLKAYKMFEEEVCSINRVVTFCKQLENPIKNEFISQLDNCGPKAAEVFKRFDADENGTLDYKEMIKMFEELFKMWAMDAEYAADDFLDDYDENEDGEINM